MDWCVSSLFEGDPRKHEYAREGVRQGRCRNQWVSTLCQSLLWAAKARLTGDFWETIWRVSHNHLK